MEWPSLQRQGRVISHFSSLCCEQYIHSITKNKPTNKCLRERSLLDICCLTDLREERGLIYCSTELRGCSFKFTLEMALFNSYILSLYTWFSVSSKQLWGITPINMHSQRIYTAKRNQGSVLYGSFPLVPSYLSNEINPL